MRSRNGALLLVLLSGCGTSAAVNAARRGDNAAVAQAVGPELQRGTLSEDEAADIARAVAEHALETSTGDDARHRVGELSLCVHAVEGALEERARKHDDAGAEAAMFLLDAGDLSESSARAWVHDPADAWRAVGVRGLVRENDSPARAAAMLDPSAKVRRAAMRASAEARMTRDVPMLLEAARVDPDLMARSEAVRAIARIDPEGGDVALRLHDLWTSSDDPLREDIARAWASPNIAAAGGAEELRGLLAAGHGPGAVSAAAFVLVRKQFDEASKTSAIGLLVRTIDQAPRRERLLALALAPMRFADVLAAVKRATDGANDLDTREAAFARLLEVPSERAGALKALIDLAAPASPETVARRARLALASDGERSVQAWIEADLKSPDATTRLLAADALVSMHRGARAAALLADADPHVRTTAACTILASR